MSWIVRVTCGGESVFSEELTWQSFTQAWALVEQHNNAGETCDMVFKNVSDAALAAADPALVTALL